MQNKNQKNTGEGNKISMADCFVISMVSPKEYGKLIKLSLGKVALYLVLLTLLVSVIQYGIPVLSAVAAMGGIKEIVLHEIPEFSFKDGKFSLSETLERSDEQAGVYILVDTGVEAFSKDDVPSGVVEAIMVSRSNAFVYNRVTGLGGMVQETRFSDFKDLTLDNERIARFSGLIYAGMFAVFAFLWLIVLAKHLFLALFYAVGMLVLTQTMTVGVPFGRIYKVALFAQSIGVIVVAVTYCVNSALFIMAGNIFNIFITITIMNRALILNERERESAG